MNIKNKFITGALLALSGAVSGFLSGLLGAGGGMVALFALTQLRSEDDPRDRFAATICAVLPMTLVSAVFYLVRGSFVFVDTLPYLLPSVIGGLAGAYALGKLPMKWIKLTLAVILLGSGGAMVFGL